MILCMSMYVYDSILCMYMLLLFYMCIFPLYSVCIESHAFVIDPRGLGESILF